MSRSISITINGTIYSHNASIPHPLVIKEVDSIKIRVSTDELEDPPEIYFEDYRSEPVFRNDDGVTFYEVPESRYFSECFGYASVRIEFKDGREIIPFDVQAKKTSVDQARKMIHYLASHSESLIKSCFSRSSLSVGSLRADSIDAETMLSTAEAFIETLQSFQLELLNNLRERLVPIRVPFWQTNMVNCEIDPYDVINNLDALTPSPYASDVFLRGRNFELAGIYVSSVQPTSDVLENRILLGGLHGIRRQVGELLEQLESFDMESADVGGDYESFSRLMLSLTAGGMIKRCQELLNATNDFIKLFERRLGVEFKGEIAPIMTPFARSTRIYRMLFTQLSSWYELGTPSITGIKFLMKLKSLSKIYEIFVLFHLIEELCRQGWKIKEAIPHNTMGEYIPSKVMLKHGEDQMTLQYEPIIKLWGSTTAHMDLIDIGHHPNAANPYWTPDFVLKLEVRNVVRYLILDAKYSTRGSVKDYHIPALFEKYYVAMAAYDAINETVTHTPIVGVFAVFSLDERSASYISKWSRHGINHSLPRIPMVGGIGLMTDNVELFNDSLATAMGVLRKTISTTGPMIGALM